MVKFERPVTYEPQDPHAYVAKVTWRSSMWAIVAMVAVEGLFVWLTVTGEVALPKGIAMVAGTTAVSALVFLLITRQVRAGAVPFAVDAPGVFMGDPAGSGRAELFPWSAISEVVLYRRWRRDSSDSRGTWERCVGIRLDVRTLPPSQRQALGGLGFGDYTPTAEQRRRAEELVSALIPGRDDPAQLVERRIDSWRLDRSALEAAVRRFAPGVRVVNGPDVKDKGIGLGGLLSAAALLRQAHREGKAPQ